VHFESLEDKSHLLLRQWLTRKLLQKLAKVAKSDPIPSLDKLTGEKFPFLPRQLLGDLIEKVDARIFHHFLVQGAVSRPIVIQGVFPARLERAGLALAIFDVLPEVDSFARGHIQANGLF